MKGLHYSGSKSSMFAVEQVGVSELDTLRSTYTILGSTTRCNTSMMTPEVGRRLIKRRGGIVPTRARTTLQGIVQRYGDGIYLVKFKFQEACAAQKRELS